MNVPEPEIVEQDPKPEIEQILQTFSQSKECTS